MTFSNQSLSRRVVIRCPVCGAAESTEAASLSGEAIIVCRECGETWHASPAKPRRRKVRRRHRVHREDQVIVAEKRALVTYSDHAEAAWQAKIEGDYWPEPPRQSRLPMVAAAMAAVLFLAAFFGGRQAAVAALPDLAGLYSAIGLNVNLDGFAIENVTAERTPTFAGSKLRIEATLRNTAGAAQHVPPLAALLYSDALVPSGAYGFDPPARTLKSGEAIPVIMELDSAPSKAAEIVVRFRRRGETLPAGGAAAIP